MNILVLIKQVPDTGINLNLTNGKLDETGLNWVLSPYDEFALEEALKIKHILNGKLFVCTLGPQRAKEALLNALALGADEAFHLLLTPSPQNPFKTAQILHKQILKINQLSLIFCGKLSVDSNNFAVPQMLAGLLDWPFVTNVNKLNYKNETFSLIRESGGGIEENLEAKRPLLISADKGLNTPRYPSLSGIMKAKKKPLHIIEIPPQDEEIKPLYFSLPPEKKSPKILTGNSNKMITELIKILKEEKVL